VSPALAFALTLALTGLPLLVLSLWARVRYARRLPSFRCRIGPPTVFWRRNRVRWRMGRPRATWVNDVLLIRSGVPRLWVTPVVAGVARGVTVQPLGSAEVRGLGCRPVSLRLTTEDGGQLEVAVAEQNAGRLVGPFLTAGMSGLPRAPHERG
jgi:hypothetical protein